MIFQKNSKLKKIDCKGLKEYYTIPSEFRAVFHIWRIAQLWFPIMLQYWWKEFLQVYLIH